MTLQSIAEVPGTDPEANEEFEGMEGPEFLKNGDILPAPVHHCARTTPRR